MRSATDPRMAATEAATYKSDPHQSLTFASHVQLAQDLPTRLRASNFTRFSEDRLSGYDRERGGVRSRVPCFSGTAGEPHEAVNTMTDFS
jgi:hypothetical protein